MGLTLKDNRKDWDAMQARVKAAGAHVVVGWVADEGGGESHGSLTNADLAAIHEFGTSDGHVSERAPLRKTWDANIAKYVAMATAGAARVLAGTSTVDKELGLIGLRFASDVKNTIKAGLEPPLADSTLRQKGAGKTTPLVDTGQLLNSITWAVRK